MSKYDNKILGKDIIISYDTSISGLNNNAIVFGTSGCGKTGSFLYPNLKCLNNMSAIVTDGKGLLYHQFHDVLVNKGYQVEWISFCNPEDSTIGWNPFDYVKDNMGKLSSRDILKFVQALLPSPSKEREPVWVQGATTLLSAIASYLIEFMPQEDHSIPSLVNLYHAILDTQTLNHVIQNSQKSHNSFSSQKFREYRANLTAERMAASYYGFINATMNSLSLPELNFIWNKDKKIDFKQISKEKTVLFISVPDADETLDTVINLFFIQALQVLLSEADTNIDGKLTIPVSLFLDDFANYSIPTFSRLLSVTRSRDISINVMLQSLSQLNTIYGEYDAMTIIDNMDTIIYMNCNNIDTATYISERCNKSVASILSLERNKQIVMLSGHSPIISNRILPYQYETSLSISPSF